MKVTESQNYIIILPIVGSKRVVFWLQNVAATTDRSNNKPCEKCCSFCTILEIFLLEFDTIGSYISVLIINEINTIR